MAQELGRMWKALTEEEKAVYEQKAELDKLRYADVSILEFGGQTKVIDIL